MVGVEAGGHSPEIAEAAAMWGMAWMAGAWSTEMMNCSEVEMSRRMEDSLGKVPTWFQKDDRGGVNRGSGEKTRKAKRVLKK